VPAPDPIPARFARIGAAFSADGFDILPTPNPADRTTTVPYQEKNGCIGIAAVSRTSKTYDNGKPKRVYYVEGDNFQMGYLIGLLAEPDVSRMTVEFAHDIVFDFLHARTLEHATGELIELIKKIIVDIVFVVSQSMKPDIPQEYVEELQGILDGCKAANPATQVTWDDLWALNFGIDCLLAHVYSGRLFKEAGIPPLLLSVPYLCNATFLGAAVTGGRHFFGRDFMFSTADVYQDTATLIVYRPDDRAGVARRPFVSQTAPGFVGSMVALNDKGVAMGVNMLPSHLCNPDRPGLNSLVLVRDTMQYASTAPEAVDRIIAAPRGVTWLYPVGDKSGHFCLVEAAAQLPVGTDIPYFSGVPAYYEKHLPDAAYIADKRAKYGTPASSRGLMTRWNDYNYPTDYITDWNEHLWKAFARSGVTHLEEILGDLSTDLENLLKGDLGALFSAIDAQLHAWIHRPKYDPASMGPLGFVDATWTDRNCPATFYFAPQRESSGDVLIGTNMAITPEMRFTMMNEWVVMLTGDQYDDMQWRYDQLNVRVQNAVAAAPITWDTAWDIANYLRPGPPLSRPEAKYHNDGDPNAQITGSISLCDLDTSTIKSLYGYYSDEPLTLHLPAYL